MTIIIIIRLRIIASNARRAISKCCRWSMTQVIDKITVMGAIIIIQVIIAYRI